MVNFEQVSHIDLVFFIADFEQVSVCWDTILLYFLFSTYTSWNIKFLISISERWFISSISYLISLFDYMFFIFHPFVAQYMSITSFISISYLFPARIYLFKVGNRNTRRRYEICSKLTKKTPERSQWHHSGVFTVTFEHILHLVLMCVLLTLNT